MSIGRELTAVDPDKEMQYAELEHFQKHSPQGDRGTNSLNHLIQEEPVSLYCRSYILYTHYCIVLYIVLCRTTPQSVFEGSVLQ